jgi:hypothetical protein
MEVDFCCGTPAVRYGGGMTTNQIKVGEWVTINGRRYGVAVKLEIGANTAAACPWLEAQYGIKGERGSVALMQVYKNGSGKLIFTTSSRAENFVAVN